MCLYNFLAFCVYCMLFVSVLPEVLAKYFTVAQSLHTCYTYKPLLKKLWKYPTLQCWVVSIFQFIWYFPTFSTQITITQGAFIVVFVFSSLLLPCSELARKNSWNRHEKVCKYVLHEWGHLHKCAPIFLIAAESVINLIIIVKSRLFKNFRVFLLELAVFEGVLNSCCDVLYLHFAIDRKLYFAAIYNICR